MYNREKAIDYARFWALKRNPNYYNFDNIGGDCTNFISQCLFAGGIDFNFSRYGWYYHSLNSRSPSWAGVDELFNFATTNSSARGPKILLSNIYNIEVGDIVQLFTNGEWSHSLLITDIAGRNLNNIYICAHDIDSLDRKLSSYRFQKIRFCKILN